MNMRDQLKLEKVVIVSFGLLSLVCLSWLPSFGAVTTTNLGDGTTRLRTDYLIPTSQVSDARDDICRGLGWTALVNCTPNDGNSRAVYSGTTQHTGYES